MAPGRASDGGERPGWRSRWAVAVLASAAAADLAKLPLRLALFLVNRKTHARDLHTMINEPQGADGQTAERTGRCEQ